jgi:D-amino-acid dehydrogenase
MACGSGKLVSDIVTGQRPEISAEGLGIERYATGRRRTGLRRPITAPA